MPPLAMVDYNNNDGCRSSVGSENTLVSVLQHKKPAAQVEAVASYAQQKKEKKNVNFQASVKVRKITSHRRYSAEEKANVWMSSVESKQIRASAVKTVKKIMKGIDVDQDPNDCSRGLEFKTPKMNKIRQSRKLDVIWSVLGEQEALQNEGKKVDDVQLADVYSTFTVRSANEACLRGLKDAMAAMAA
jgi:hypothetical protein